MSSGCIMNNGPGSYSLLNKNQSQQNLNGYNSSDHNPTIMRYLGSNESSNLSQSNSIGSATESPSIDFMLNNSYNDANGQFGQQLQQQNQPLMQQ